MEKLYVHTNIFTISIMDGGFTTWIQEDLEGIVKSDFALIYQLQSDKSQTHTHTNKENYVHGSITLRAQEEKSPFKTYNGSGMHSNDSKYP